MKDSEKLKKSNAELDLETEQLRKDLKGFFGEQFVKRQKA